MLQKKLEKLQLKFCSVEHNEDNYGIGGGLSSDKFASRRHEDARNDQGKLTLGEATQLFKKATGWETEAIRQMLHRTFPNMEWHHAGKLPKQYGGGMKKTYFLTAAEICYIASHWEKLIEDYRIACDNEFKEIQNRNALKLQKDEFLKANAKYVVRAEASPVHTRYITICYECEGKFGWFDASKNKYRLKEYWTGWEFENEEIYNQYLKLQ